MYIPDLTERYPEGFNCSPEMSDEDIAWAEFEKSFYEEQELPDPRTPHYMKFHSSEIREMFSMMANGCTYEVLNTTDGTPAIRLTTPKGYSRLFTYERDEDLELPFEV